MAQLINLKRVKKNRARAEKDAAAEANRIRFGTPKALRARNEAEAAKAARTLEEKRLESPEKPEN